MQPLLVPEPLPPLRILGCENSVSLTVARLLNNDVMCQRRLINIYCPHSLRYCPFSEQPFSCSVTSSDSEGTYPALVTLVALVTSLAARGDGVGGTLLAPLRQGEPHRLVALLLVVGQGWQGAGGRGATACLPLGLPPLPPVAYPRACSDLLQLLLHSGEVAKALPPGDGGALPVERARPHLTQKPLLVPQNPRPPKTPKTGHDDRKPAHYTESSNPLRSCTTASLRTRRHLRGYCSRWRLWRAADSDGSARCAAECGAL